MNDALSSTAPAIGTKTIGQRPGSASATPSTAATGSPSASEGQKRRWYRRTDSATSCPMVRVSGGSGGGSSRVPGTRQR